MFLEILINSFVTEILLSITKQTELTAVSSVC